VSFEWSVDPALTAFSTVAAGTTTNGTSPESVSAVLSGLTAGMTYYYRIVGANAENEQPQRGGVRSFTLPASRRCKPGD
jgi:phosphodiesterase/alkaline phosphatase D-like protein